MKREDVLWTLAGLGFVHSYLTGSLTGTAFSAGIALYLLHHRASFVPSIEVRVEPPDELEEGKDAIIKVHTLNRGSPVNVIFYSKTSPKIEGIVIRNVRTFLTRGESTTIELPIKPALRGNYGVTLEAELLDPSGLYMGKVSLGTLTLKVYPSVDSIREAAREEKNIRLAQAYRKGLAAGLETIDFYGLREYYPGDDLRRIDWKASARLGELIVRELMKEQESPVYIVLDATRGMRRRIKKSRVDYASTLVMYLAALLITKNHRTGLIVYSEKGIKVIPPSTGKEQINRIRLAMEFTPERGLPAMRAEIGELGEKSRYFLSKIFPRRRRGITEALLEIKEPSHIFLVTDLMGETTRLYRVISMLKKKHRILVLSPNPILFTNVELNEETLKTLYRRYLERENLLKKFSSLVPTIDLGPEDYTLEIINKAGDAM